MIDIIVNISLLLMLVVTAFATIFVRDLFGAIMLFGIYSLLCASFFLNLTAPDVALTEAAIGAGVAPILMLATLALIRKKVEIEPQVKKQSSMKILPVIITIATGAILIYATFDMPYFADATAPAHNHVAPRYIQNSGTEIDIPNIVTSVLASYRGFDTLGEVFVIFTAGIGVMTLLGLGMGGTKRGAKYEQFKDSSTLRKHTVLHVISKILIPIILLYAFYVQFHGEYSPGGGFQAGVIFAAAFILYSMIYGLQTTYKIISKRYLSLAMVFGVLLYAGTGIVAMLKGGNYLDYNTLATNPITGQHIGIILVELGVGICVASVMLFVFFNFAGRAIDEPNTGGQNKK